MARWFGAVLSAIVLALSLPSSRALFGLDGSGGTFRYGHIYYRMLRENTVEFTIEAAFTREVDTSYFYGSALDGYSQLGDQITMTGRETPQFELGDEGLITKLTMDVIAYSVSENWVMGKTVIVHKYEYPNNAGNPWLARFSGCCRFSQLRNNGDKPWELFAQVDLTQASASPRVSVLPIVSVPKESKMPDEDFDGVIGPKVIVPATIPVAGEPKTKAVYWATKQPFDVGNAAGFDQAFMSLPLQPFFDKTARICCTNPEDARCSAEVRKNPSVSTGCLARLLTTDYQGDPAGKRTVSPAISIEGWVKINQAEGGVVLSTGLEAGRAQCANKGACQVALIYIKVNATHVIVGHERALDDAGSTWKLETVAFAISSSAALVEQLTDKEFYLCGTPPCSSSLQGKFVHVMVVRKSLVGPSQNREKGNEPLHLYTVGSENYQEDWFSTYKVYVNGFMLEVAKYPFCAAGAECKNGERFGGFSRRQFVSPSSLSDSFSGCYFTEDEGGKVTQGDPTAEDGCKVELEIGESNPLQGPRRPRKSTKEGNKLIVDTVQAHDTSGRCSLDVDHAFCQDDFGSNTSLLFGAYRGAARDPSYFDGVLDEWRIWNGERSRADLLDSYRRPLYPTMNQNYGDPTIMPDESGQGQLVESSNYKTTTLLMALYSFDGSVDKATATDPDGCPTLTENCKFKTMRPTFPQYKADSDQMKTWEARVGVASTCQGSMVVEESACAVKNHPTDATGVMFFKGGNLYRVDECDPAQGTCIGQVSFLAQPAPGMYQVTLQVASGKPPKPSVPVDFVVEVIDSVYEPDQVAYKLNDKNKFTFNDYIPSITFAAPVKKVEAAEVAEFVGSGQLPDIKVPTAPEDSCQKTGTCWNVFDDFVYPKTAKAFAGFLIEVKIKGEDLQDKTSINMPTIYDSKNTKVGFSIGPAPDSMRFTSIKDTNPAEMMMSWTPCEQELGNTIVCFDAVDRHIIRDENDPSKVTVDNHAASDMRCLNLDVQLDPSPKFEENVPAQRTLYIGREDTIDLRAWDDNCNDKIMIDISPSSTLPPGAQLDKQVKTSTSCTSAMRTMRWTPGSKMGGFKGRTCFEVRDTGGNKVCGIKVKRAQHCVDLEVLRCQYALQKDQQLQEVSVLFGVDWMRLWSLNIDMHHPDYVLYEKQQINIGHLYTVAPNERMDWISERLGMPLQQLRDLNYDIARNHTVQAGQTLCVVPNSCRGAKETFYSKMVYKDEKFFAEAKTSH